MTWGMIGAAAITTVGGSMLNKSGGGGGGGGHTYVPMDQQGRDQNFLWAENAYGGTLGNYFGNVDPYNYTQLQQQFNNPYAQGFQDNANAAGQWAQNAAWRDNQGATSMFNNGDAASAQGRTAMGNYNALNGSVTGAANTMFGMAGDSNKTYDKLMGYQWGQQPNVQRSSQNLYGGGNAVMNTAFDPQHALYDRTRDQLVDQTRSAEYARGIQMSPAGANVEANALGNFNIDWQNQQLARQSQGLQAAQGAYGAGQGMNNSFTNNLSGLETSKNQNYSNLASGAANMAGNWNQSMGNTANSFANATARDYMAQADLGGQAVQQQWNGGAMPYNANQTMYGNRNQALQNYWGNVSPYLSGMNQLQSNDLGYMNQGQAAQNQAWNQNMGNQQWQNQLAQQYGGPMTSALSNWWNGGYPSYGGGFNAGGFNDANNPANIGPWE